MPKKIPFPQGHTYAPDQLKEIPTVEEFAGFSSKEKEKLITQIQKDLSRSRRDISASDDHYAQQRVDLFEGQLTAYKTIKTPKERAKDAEKKQIESTGDPIKWDAMEWAGALAGTAAIYEGVVGTLNDYIDDQIEEALKPKRCNYDGEKALEYTKKCKTDSDCGPSQKCIKKISAFGQEIYLNEASDSFNFPDKVGPDEGRCANACVRPETIKFFSGDASITDLIKGVTESVPLSACISPYFVKFFNVIPWQFYLMKKLEGMVNDLLSYTNVVDINEINKQIKERTICGEENGLDIEKIKESARIPSLLGSIFPLPALPHLKIPIPEILRILVDPLSIVRKIVIDLLCYELCKLLNPIMLIATQAMLELERNMMESYNKETGQTLPSYEDFQLETIDVNRFILDRVLKDAGKLGHVTLGEVNFQGETSYNAGHFHNFTIDDDGHGTAELKCHPNTNKICHSHKIYNGAVMSSQSTCYPYCKQVHGIEGVEPHTHTLPDTGLGLLRDYIEFVNKKLEVRDVIILLTGDASCDVRMQLIKIGRASEGFIDYTINPPDKYQSLELDEEERILKFWKYLGDHMNVFAFIEDSKAACYPDVCPPQIQDKMLNDIVDQMNTICELLKTPEKLLPLDADDLERMALDIANQLLPDGSKLDRNDPSAILTPESRKQNGLTKRCRMTKRTNLLGVETGGTYNHFEGDPNDFTESEANKNAAFGKINDCAGEYKKAGSTAAAKKKKETEVKDKKTEEKFETKKPCCKYSGENEITFFKTYTPGEELLAIGPNQKNVAFTNKLIKIYDELRGVTFGWNVDNVVNAISLMSEAEKCWLCRRGPAFKGGNSFLSYIQADIEAGLDDTDFATRLAKALNCHKYGMWPFWPRYHYLNSDKYGASTPLKPAKVQGGKVLEKCEWTEADEKTYEKAKKETKAGKVKEWIKTWEGGKTPTQGEIRAEFWEYAGKVYVWLDYGKPYWYGPISEATKKYIKSRASIVQKNPKNKLLINNEVMKLLTNYFFSKEGHTKGSKNYDDKPWVV
tara:strand:+ start:4701 stop:7787 length:3087 start_codon:yes stop_codon:yes gene_type:complete